MTRRCRRALSDACVALLLLLGSTTVGAAPPAAAALASCSSAFSSAFSAALAQRYPGIKVTAAVYDTHTGCWHHLHQGLQLTTASVIKAQVLGAVLLRAQDAGRGLSAWERSQIGPMIRLSFNPETSALYDHIGSVAGMAATDAAFGATATTHVRPFGLTRSTAVDRTRVALKLLYGTGPLRQAGREDAWEYMSTVHPLQRWGITAGVPEGWSVALKNGFYPSSGIGWRVGSSGFVRRDAAGQGYAITVMTEGASSQSTGIRLVEEVARRAAAALTVGPAAPRAIDRARCVRTSAGEPWSSVAARLGLPSSRAGEIRTVTGGDSAALSGMQACSPDIPPEPVAPTSTVNGRYRAVVSDLDCDGRDDLLWYAPGDAPDFRWAGHPDHRFRGRSLTVRGDYIPVAGDFDGDGCGDVLWYGPGTTADSIWYGGTSVTVRSVSVAGLAYWPAVGDFDGDGRDDVLWYGPGSVADSIWFGARTRGAFATVAQSVRGAYQPVVGDLDGDGADDLVWYVPGATADPVWAGRVGARGVFAKTTTTVGGRYRPVAGDLDGDGADELFWHGPGTTLDFRWDGLPPAHTTAAASVGGSYLPQVGDFDGDGRDDIAWYGPGGAAESAWWYGPGGTPTPGPLVTL